MRGEPLVGGGQGGSVLREGGQRAEWGQPVPREGWTLSLLGREPDTRKGPGLAWWGVRRGGCEGRLRPGLERTPRRKQGTSELGAPQGGGVVGGVHPDSTSPWCSGPEPGSLTQSRALARTCCWPWGLCDCSALHSNAGGDPLCLGTSQRPGKPHIHLTERPEHLCLQGSWRWFGFIRTSAVFIAFEISFT